MIKSQGHSKRPGNGHDKFGYSDRRVIRIPADLDFITSLAALIGSDQRAVRKSGQRYPGSLLFEGYVIEVLYFKSVYGKGDIGGRVHHRGSIGWNIRYPGTGAGICGGGECRPAQEQEGEKTCYFIETMGNHRCLVKN